MTEWFNSGYFTMALSVRRACDERYVQLGELTKMWGRLPFLSGSGGTPHHPPLKAADVHPMVAEQEKVKSRSFVIVLNLVIDERCFATAAPVDPAAADAAANVPGTDAANATAAAARSQTASRGGKVVANGRLGESLSCSTTTGQYSFFLFGLDLLKKLHTIIQLGCESTHGQPSATSTSSPRGSRRWRSSPSAA